MRRGKLNKSSLLLISIVALFTVLSFIFDQLVIRSEDKIRNLNINHQNKKNMIVELENISSTLTEFSLAVSLNFSPLAARRNVLIKARILSDFGDKFNFFSGKNNKKNEDQIEWMILKELNKVARLKTEIRIQYIDYYKSKREIIDKVNHLPEKKLENLFKADFNPFETKEEKKNFFNKDIDTYTKLIGYGYHWKEKPKKDLEDYREKALNEFGSRDWYDVYHYKMLLLDDLFNDSIILDNLIDLIDLEAANKDEDLNKIFEEIKYTSIKKNYFILISILAQIFSLMFLLLLFRNFLVNFKR